MGYKFIFIKINHLSIEFYSKKILHVKLYTNPKILNLF